MLKAILGTDKGNIYVLGLSKVNIERLLMGNPILFDNADLNLPGRTLIIVGETEKDIQEFFESEIAKKKILD